MIKNYILVAFRNFFKKGGYATVNLLGLALGLATSALIFMYVADELAFDSMHPKASSTYRIGYSIKFPNGDIDVGPSAPAGWDNFLKSNFECVKDISSYAKYGMVTSIYNDSNEKIITTEELIWAESNIPDLIYLPISSGNKINPLKDANSIMITESAAHELFGASNPINKVLSVSHQWATHGKKVDLVITAIIKDLPTNSHVNPKYVANILALKPFNENLEGLLDDSMGDRGDSFATQSYFVCADESKIPLLKKTLKNKLDEIIAKKGWPIKLSPIIRKITDVHFDKEIDWSISHKTADIKYVYIFGLIAFLILIVGSINFISLFTAMSTSRSKEIGLRKSFGGTQKELFFQFLLESFLWVFISAIIAIFLIVLLIPQFNSLTAKNFSLYDALKFKNLFFILGAIVCVSIIAGGYPAFLVSSFKPTDAVKGNISFVKGPTIVKQFLITFQLIVATSLITGTLILVRQMNFLKDSKLANIGEKIISVRFSGLDGLTNNKYLLFKHEILMNKKILHVTIANHLPRLDYFGPINMQLEFPEIGNEKYQWFQLNSDYDFIKTFKLRIIAGHDFDPNNIVDSSSVILNESAVRSLHLDPTQVIGKQIIRPDWSIGYSPPDKNKSPISGNVIGVVKDFSYKSMYKTIDPLVISAKPHEVDRVIYVSLPTGGIQENIEFLEAAWKRSFKDTAFDYWFIDDEFSRMYQSEIRVSNLITLFSAVAISIVCVGLYGLASFLAIKRRREIGVRKVLGASTGQITVLFLNTFVKILFVSCLVSIPLTYFLARQWLSNFAFHIDLKSWIFAESVLIIMVTMILTIGYETVRAANANPAKVIKDE